jgi:hypothetical protein
LKPFFNWLSNEHNKASQTLLAPLAAANAIFTGRSMAIATTAREVRDLGASNLAEGERLPLGDQDQWSSTG